MKMRILFIGQNWHGSNSTSFIRAFRSLGCDVLVVDEEHFFPRWQTLTMKGIRRLLRPLVIRDFSFELHKQYNGFRPELVFVYKGVMVKNIDLYYFHNLGTKNFIFYPDVNLVSGYSKFGNNVWRCIQEYDVFFTPKSYQIDILKKSNVRRCEFLPYAYDPWCHYPVDLSSEDYRMYRSDIVFIGTWGQERAELLERLVSKDFPYQLAVWGNFWERLDLNSPLRKYVKFVPAYGEMQAKILASCKIALAFLSPPDLHTARTFEIPAYGAFMLAERTKEHRKFFVEDKEIACFNDVDELCEKIKYYLQHDQERQEIAKAGFRKVTTGGHSYIDRVKQVLQIYEELK